MTGKIVVFGLATALALTGCDSGTVPGPAERRQVDTATQAIAINAVELRGEGLAVDAQTYPFATGQAEAEAALAKVLGQALRTWSNSECGAGPMDFSGYPGGLTLNYQDGVLVGWYLDAASEKVVPEGGVGIGAPGERVTSLPGFAPVEDSTLGEEFYSEAEGLGGFIEEGRVASLYAGTNCFFR